MRPSVEVLLVTAVAGLALAALSWPVVAEPGHFVVGGSANDHASIAWTLDFVADRLAHGFVPWGWTDRIEFPDGATLMPADLPEAVLLAPLTLLWGGVVALNVLLLGHLALSAGCAWGWLRSTGASVAGAAVGAIGFAACPALLTSTFNGNADVTPWYWIPAALWVGSAPGLGRAVAAGGLVALAGACNPYVGVMSGLALGISLLGERRWRDLGVVAILALVGAVGVMAGTAAAMQAADAAVRKGARYDSLGTTALLSLVNPVPQVYRTDPLWSPPRVAVGSYLGLSLLGLALLGRRRRGWVLAMVGLGVLLALGPTLRLYEDPAPPVWKIDDPMGGGSGDTHLPLPGALLAGLPGLSQLHLTHRFTGLAALGLAWGAAFGVERLGRLRGWMAAVVALDLMGLAGGAALVRAAPLWEDGACALLEGKPKGAVIDLPVTHHELGMLSSLCHRRPVAEGINRELPGSLKRRLDKLEPAEALRLLKGLGFRYLVWHGELPHRAGAELLGELEGCAVGESGQTRVFDLRCRRKGKGAGDQP